MQKTTNRGKTEHIRDDPFRDVCGDDAMLKIAHGVSAEYALALYVYDFADGCLSQKSTRANIPVCAVKRHCGRLCDVVDSVSLCVDSAVGGDDVTAKKYEQNCAGDSVPDTVRTPRAVLWCAVCTRAGADVFIQL